MNEADLQASNNRYQLTLKAKFLSELEGKWWALTGSNR